MAWTTGVASNYQDLLSDLVGFLTTDLGDDNWTLLHNSTEDFTAGSGFVALEAPGAVGLDAIHIQIALVTDIPNARYNWALQGSTDFNAGLAFGNQPGSIPSAQSEKVLLLSNSSMTYWFAADGQRVVVVATVGSVVQSAYLGYCEVYGPPSDYPYPLFVGGCHWDRTAASSSTAAAHTFWGLSLGATATPSVASASLRLPSGWIPANGYGTSQLAGSTPWFCVGPGAMQRTDLVLATTEAGDHVMWDAELVVHALPMAGQVGDKMPVGRLVGVKWLAGYGLSTGDIVQWDGDDYLVFGNTFRTGILDFLAVRLGASE